MGEKAQAIISEKEVSIQNIAYLTSNANDIRHETGNATQRVIRK